MDKNKDSMKRKIINVLLKAEREDIYYDDVADEILSLFNDVGSDFKPCFTCQNSEECKKEGICYDKT